MVVVYNTVGSETRVNTYTLGNQSGTQITTLRDGGYVITWKSAGQDGGDEGIFAQAYNANGTARGMETQINTYSLGAQHGQQITALNDGGYVITWTSYDQDSSASGVYAQAYNATGTARGTETLVNTYTLGDQHSPQITALSDGGYVIVWESNHQDGSEIGIYAQGYDSNGAPRGDETLINTRTTNYQFAQQITALSDGGYVITWTSYAQDGDGWGVYAQAYDSEGSAFGDETQINTYTLGAQHGQQITALHDGGYVITWTSYDHDGDFYGNIYAQAYNADGTARGGETRVNTNTDGDQELPQITALSNGGYVITWTSSHQDGDGWGVYAQAYRADGTQLGDETRVNTNTTGSQYGQQITALSDGGYVITWESFGQDGYVVIIDGHNNVGWGVHAQAYNADGTARGGEVNINTDASAYDPDPQITALSNGRFVITWESDVLGNGNDDVFAQMFAPSSSVTDLAMSKSSVNEVAISNIAIGSISGVSSINSALTYEIIGDTSGGAFAIIGNQLFVADNRKLDFETAPSVTLTIQATDVNGGTYQEAFVLAVQDSVNELRYSASDEFRVNTTTDGEQEFQQIAALSDGGYVITWMSSDEVSDKLGVYAQAYNADGTPRGGETEVYTQTGNRESPPHITALTGGGYIITWPSFGRDGDDYGIYAQAYNANGTAYEAEFLVNTHTTNDQLSLEITALSTGGYVMTWMSYEQDGESWGIYAQAYNADGTPRGDETQVNTHTTGNQGAPEITALSDDGYVIVWQSEGQDGQYTGVYAQAYNADGTVRGDETLVNTYTTNFQLTPRITALADGDYVITWVSYSQDGDDAGVYAQVFNANGTSRGGETRVNTYTSGTQTHQQIAALSDGGYVITWISDGQGGPGLGVYAQAFNADGTARGTETRVNSYTPGDQHSPQITALSNGGYVISWTSDGQDGSGMGVYAQMFNADGTAHGAETRINGDTAGDQAYPEITALADGDYVITWQSNGQDGSPSGIYARKFTALPFAPVVANPIADQSVNEDTAWTFTFAANAFTDVDSDTLSYTAALGNGDALPSWLSFSAATRTFTGTPPASFTGDIAIKVTASDGEQQVSDTFTLTVNDAPVVPANHAPIAVDDRFDAIEETGARWHVADLLENDTDRDGDPLTITQLLNMHGGSVRIAGDEMIFTPWRGFTGTAGFDYTISDGQGGTDTAHVTVQVAPAAENPGNHAPVLSSIAPVVTIAGKGIALKAAAADADGDTLTFSASTPAHGAVSTDVGGRILYTPDNGFIGTDSFMLSVSDGKGGTASQVVQVTVAAIGEQPQWQMLTEDGFAGAIGGAGLIYGTSGFEDITALDLPGTMRLDGSFNRGGDLVRLDGSASDWRAALTGSSAVFSDGDTFVVIPVGISAMAIVFDDGARALRYDSAADEVRIGSQVISQVLDVILAAPSQGALPDATANDAAARILMNSEGTVTAGGNLTVFGTKDHEVVHILHGNVVLDGSFNRGGDRIVLDGDANGFTAMAISSKIVLEGEHASLTIPVGVAGTTIAFADGEQTLRYDLGLDAVFLDSLQIAATPIPIPDFT